MKQRRIILFPYKLGSQSCRDLATYLRTRHGGRVLRVAADGHYKPLGRDIVVNWGNSKLPRWSHEMFNKPVNVSYSVNKLACFNALNEAGISTVPFTTDKEVAKDYEMIVERHKLCSYGGDGIVISDYETVGNAPLYTELLTPATEYRVHVFKGEVIDYTKKIKRVEEGIKSRIAGDFIKNSENGWEYIRDVEPRPSVKELAIATIEALGLDFGAVDILRHERVNYVLEVGTASGLSPMGVKAYGEAILKLRV